MRRTRIILAAGVVAAAQASVWAQVTAAVLSNGQSAVTVAPGPVDLALDVRLDSSVPLHAVEFTLECSQPALFAYGDPPMTTGAPWTAEELMVISGEVVGGDPLTTRPDILLYKWTLPDYPAESFPSTILTFKVRSVGDLAAGTSYTFGLGATELPPLWIGTGEDGSNDDGYASGDIDLAVFTLTVSGGGGGAGGGSNGDTGDGGDIGDGDDTGDGDDDTGDGTEPGDPDDGGETGVVDVDGDGDTGTSDDGGNGGSGTDEPGMSEGGNEEQGPPPAPRVFFCGSGAGGATLAGLVGLGLLPRRRRVE